jgi:SecY interacting protein Syd
MRTLADALDDFIDHYVKSVQPLLEPFDAEWGSPCETGEPLDLDGKAVIAWRPVRRNDMNVLIRLEAAFETRLHPDLATWWGRWFSGHLEAQAPDGPLTLLQLWNPADGDRMVENQIGHVMAQRRAKAPLSFFFACTADESDLQLTVDNQSGQVLLEPPGRKPLRVLAPDLATFIDELVPRSTAPLAQDGTPRVR